MPCLPVLLAALACGLTAGCSAGPQVAAIPLPSHGAARVPPGAAVAGGDVATADAAQQLVFANRYDAAEAAYTHLISIDSQDAGALAGYALFLTYRLDHEGARREIAAALQLAPRDAAVLAVACRVADWAGDVLAAVAAGRQAVAADPGDALGHIFLAEALADHGDLAGAGDELAVARALVSERSSAYERAELQREIGTLARAVGDRPAEVAAFQEAARLQPGWVERPSELAGADIDGGDIAGAHAALQRALTLAPDDAELLRSLGAIAMLEDDYDSADRAFTRLGTLRAGDAGALTLAAHARMAHTADIDAAVGLLEEAVSVSPQDAEAAGYLLALERYVRGDPGRGEAEITAAAAAHRDDLEPARPHLTAQGAAPDAIEADHQAAALAAINGIRQQAGLPAVTLDPALAAAAVQHCYYWFFNNAADAVRGLGIHQETVGLPGYAGVGAGDRAAAQGWHSGQVGEDITHRGSPQAAVGDWVTSVYHRFPILRSDLSAIGYGDCGVGSLTMEDMEFGYGHQGGDHHAPTPYPADGQTGVPSEFVDNELPDPVPTGQARTTGYPVTVDFDPRETVSVSVFSLTDGSGRRLDGYRLEPGSATENAASLLPVVPLTPGSRYTAHIAGTRGQVAFDLSWSFVVGAG